MTTAQKLWLGFGTLTALLLAVSLTIIVRLSFINAEVTEMANVARPRGSAARELEINVTGYALAVNEYLYRGDPNARKEAAEDAADVEREQAEYERLVRTDRQREMANRFATMWKEIHALGQTILNAEDRQPTPQDVARFHDLRIRLEKLLNEEMQPDAFVTYNARKDAILQDVQTIVGFALILLIAGVVIAVLTSVTVGRAVVKGERAIAEQGERLRTTLASIGDAVIATDTEGRITNMNAVAESLTGWKNAEAVGQPLDAVFCILNQQTRQRVENPVQKVLKLGRVVGLANHTVLIAKDGRERPIDDSAAPIRGKEGEIVGCVLVFRDVTERRRVEQKQTDDAARIESVLNTVVDGIVTIDQTGTVETLNPAAERLFGYNAKEVIGQNVKLLMPEPYRHEHDNYIANYLRTGEAKIIGIGREVVGRCKDGSTFPMELAVSEFTLGGRRYFTGIVRDITGRKRAEEALKEADRRKDEFLATLAHELRNPLAPIYNAVQILLTKGPPDPDLKFSREVIDRQVRHMSRLLDDLLDVSRITHNKLELRKERIELAVVVQNAVETSRPLIDSGAQELIVTLPPEPVYLDADPVRLAQVFSNLLNNAAKYSELDGHIRLTCERLGGNVVVSVKDDGMGIAAEMLPRIFDIFSQANRVLERSQGGIGVGLSLVRGLVELHGGRIEAHSEGPGKGSEFVVRLPVVVAKVAQEAVPPSKDGEQECVTKRRVLIVDDLKDSADSLAMLLKMMGHEAYTAYDGEDALVAAEKFKPDVVLLDIGMPKLNGYEVCRRIRQQPWGKNMFRIALTGWGQDDDRRRTEEAGFHRHMVKPVDPGELMKLLASMHGRTDAS